MNPKTGGQVALGCGLLLVLSSCLASGFFGFHVFLDPHGAISDDEAAPGLIGGALCFLVSVVIAGGGAFLAFRQQPAAGAPGVPGVPGAPGAAGPNQIPAIGLGCLGLVALLCTCIATGAIPYFNSERERWIRMRDEDRASGYDPLLVEIDESAIRHREEEMTYSAASAACCGLTTLALFGIAGFLYQRAKKGPTS